MGLDFLVFIYFAFTEKQKPKKKKKLKNNHHFINMIRNKQIESFNNNTKHQLQPELISRPISEPISKREIIKEEESIELPLYQP